MLETPAIVLNRNARAPLTTQLVERLREAIVQGGLRPGDRLPSTRELAAQLGISRTVTASAYDQLQGEGWLYGRHGSGTFVDQMPAAQSAPRPSSIVHVPRRAGLRPHLLPGAGCVDLVDAAVWRRAWRAASDQPPDYWSDPVGDAAFRHAVAEQFLRARGLQVQANDVLATSGTPAAIVEIARHFPRGALVAVEDPGYWRAMNAFREAGLACVPVPVDEEGLVVEAMPPGISAVFTSPAYQFPLGVRMSAPRRVALVDRARREGFLIVEDDYDGELRFGHAPLPLLGSLGPDVTVHLGEMSKLVGATLGAGWMVAPTDLAQALVDTRIRTGAHPARGGQRVFAAMIANGDVARLLRKARATFAERRRIVEAMLEEVGLVATGELAGAHVFIPLPDEELETAIVEEGVAHRLDLTPLRHSWLETAHRHGIVLGYSACSTAELEIALHDLSEVLKAVLGRAGLSGSAAPAAGPRAAAPC